MKMINKREMMIVKSLFFSFFFFLNGTINYAQPKWYKKTPISSSGKYHYIAIEIKNNEEANEQILKAATTYFGEVEQGKTEFKEHIIIKDGKVEDYTSISGTASFGNQKVKYKVIEQAYINKKLYLLFMFEEKNKTTLPKAKSFSIPKASLYSLLLPGTGQLYKKNKLKGGMFLSSFLLFTGTAFYSHAKKEVLLDDFNNASTFEEREDIKDKATQFKNFRNLSLGAAGIIYIVSIVDVLTTSGNRYAYHPTNKKAYYNLAYNPIMRKPEFSFSYRF